MYFPILLLYDDNDSHLKLKKMGFCGYITAAIKLHRKANR